MLRGDKKRNQGIKSKIARSAEEADQPMATCPPSDDLSIVPVLHEHIPSEQSTHLRLSFAFP